MHAATSLPSAQWYRVAFKFSSGQVMLIWTSLLLTYLVWSTLTLAVFVYRTQTGFATPLACRLSSPKFNSLNRPNSMQHHWSCIPSMACSMAHSCYDKDLHDWFLFILLMYWYWSHSDSRFIFLPASGPIVRFDSCTARCCDSELRLTVHYCALWPIVAVTLLFLWRLLIVLLQYISQACWVLCSPRLDFFHRTVNRYFGSSQ